VLLCFGGSIFRGGSLEVLVYRLYAAPFVFSFVHLLRLAGMTFNNICRFKNQKKKILCIAKDIIPKHFRIYLIG
jgi:hypothetical protein